MKTALQLDNYQLRVAAMYGARAATYDSTPGNSDWHRRIAELLVRRARLQSGQRALDIATGTGLVALDAAGCVGADGYVLGIDISPTMLEQAQGKATALNLTQAHFELADAERLYLPNAKFDQVLCCAALVWMRDVANAFKQWFEVIKPGGWLNVQAHPDTALVTSRVIQELAALEGVDIRLHREIGSSSRLYALLESAGFIDIDILVVPDSIFLTMEQALAWAPNFEFPAPGQDPPPFRNCPPMRMEHLRKNYEEAMCKLITPLGIKNDCTSMLARARRPLG